MADLTVLMTVHTMVGMKEYY